MRRMSCLLVLVLAVGVVCLSGCGDTPTPPERLSTYPETELTFAPIDADTTSFRVRFFWNGFDKDGEVVRFRYAVDADSTRPSNQWNSTTAKDTTFLFLVDPVQEIRQHVFMIASEDNEGQIDRTPARRFFSAKTLPPTSEIERGPSAFNPLVGPNFTFEWSGIDPDGGETGGRAPVDSFEYLLLLVGTFKEAGHPPLPTFDQAKYVDMINDATGRTLEPPHDDWRWVGIRGIRNRFRNATPGEYVFAERAVDIAGATEKNIEFIRNIRHFTVTTRNPGPTLIIRSSVLVTSLPPTTGPEDSPREALQIFEGETISFSWTANADAYGGEIVGYTFALDDTASFPGIDLLRTGATFTPDMLPPGNHFLFVRAIDDGGLVTNAVIPIRIVHPDFKDATTPPRILYVDDFLAPGNVKSRIGNYPADVQEEDPWWELTILPTLGIPYDVWDTKVAGELIDNLKKPPEPRHLAAYRAVIWSVDFNNGAADPTGLWKTLVGGAYSELGGYLRAGGALILTGFNIGGNTINPSSNLYSFTSRGICFSFEPGTVNFERSYFPRIMMGVDGAIPNGEGTRTAGARDFIAAYPTPGGAAMGFDSAFVDRGALGSGAKWITYEGGDPNTNRQPGLPQVDGWIMGSTFGCSENPTATFKVENSLEPIALPIYTYHGVRTGINEEGGASPREGLVVGIRTQAHDLGGLGGGPLTPGAPGAVGRMVHLAFPMYWLHDENVLNILQTALNYVNGSPTLP